MGEAGLFLETIIPTVLTRKLSAIADNPPITSQSQSPGRLSSEGRWVFQTTRQPSWFLAICEISLSSLSNKLKRLPILAPRG
jgi:hypothetical protein